jgi:predicted DNA-binding antitoxin AbrB/MazE fold protein
MSKRLEAVYENGVLRPLESLDLREHQRVTVVVSEKPVTSPEEAWLDVECWQRCATEADESISLEAVREALSKIPGSLTADFIAEREDR